MKLFAACSAIQACDADRNALDVYIVCLIVASSGMGDPQGRQQWGNTVAVSGPDPAIPGPTAAVHTATNLYDCFD